MTTTVSHALFLNPSQAACNIAILVNQHPYESQQPL